MTCTHVRMLVAAIALLIAAASAGAQTVRRINADLVEVTATGSGMTREEALNDAYRKAVESGAGTYIHSQTQTRDFVLVRDTVLTRATGFLQSKQVLSQRQLPDGSWEVQVRAVVSVRGVIDTWGAVTNLLQNRGRPKVLVALDERIDGQPQAESILRAQIENVLKTSGFRLVAQSQIKAIEQKDLQTALVEDKPATVQAIAKRFGAQIFVMGTSRATGQRRNIGGLTAFGHTAVGVVRTFRADTGELLSSRTQRQTGVDRSVLGSAQKALKNLGTVTAPRITRDVLRFWQDALEGRGEVQMEVEQLGKFSNYLKVKRAIAAIEGVKAVNGNFHNGVAKLSIESGLTAEMLAEKISNALEKMVEIEDLSQNVIKGKFVGQ